MQVLPARLPVAVPLGMGATCALLSMNTLSDVALPLLHSRMQPKRCCSSTRCAAALRNH